MTEIGRGIGVEVTERDHDDDREQGGRCDQPGRPITTRQGPNLHQRCRTGGVSRPGASIYTPSHTSSHTPISDKSFHINQIPTKPTTPRCRKLVQGVSRGATHRKTGVLRTRQVFLCHTCRAGSLPLKSSLAGRRFRPVSGPAGRHRERRSAVAPTVAGSNVVALDCAVDAHQIMASALEEQCVLPVRGALTTSVASPG